ncbi:hypothetical protein ARMGADRAFT_1087469 [Armillaria gallica]|uniref:Altered inheritance of mitochondria protein 9, mitochondrial n=1 Tax=Armillaria gallica TaxID=47427 RepID=A0A2H3D1H9_ARMGA|nr:hypothetical protein ARMGADRAFT_1087469 [Armillaria gallica]
MEHVRDVIGHPTPRVLAWSSTPKARSAVGSDLILMEHIRTIVLQVSLQLQNRPFYPTEKDNEEPAVEKYRIGPVIEKQYWFNKPVEEDRGPWFDVMTSIQTTCRLALRRAESQASSAASSSPSPSSLLSRSKPSDLPELRRLMQQRISMAPHIIPLERGLTAPYLIHPDLSPSNVIANPSGAANVVSCIDWQGGVAFLALRVSVYLKLFFMRKNLKSPGPSWGQHIKFPGLGSPPGFMAYFAD